MTALSSLSSLTPAATAAARALSSATVPPADTPPPAAVVAPSPSDASAASSMDALQSMLPRAPRVLAWETKSHDAVSSLMTVNYGAPQLSGRFQGLGAALLNRLGTDGSDFSQSVLQSPPDARAGAQATALDALSRQVLHGAAANRIALDIKTADGVKVTVTLGSQDQGLAVQIHSSGKLSDADRGALARLADAFQSAIDGIGAVPPKLALSGLTQYDPALLASVDLHAQVQLGGAQPQTMDFHADSAQRSVGTDGPQGSVKVSVDLSHPDQLGNAQQRKSAMDGYLTQFNQAGSRGKADAAMLALFKDAFQQMNGALPQQHPGAAQPLALKPGDHAVLTGLADFSAAMTDSDSAPNPMRPGESDTYAYHATQTTTIGGHGALDRTISQQQSAHLDASFHEALSADTPLALHGSRQSQNYYYKQISDDASSDAELGYRQGVLAQASLRQTASQSTRVAKYVAGALTEDATTPVSATVLHDLLGLLQDTQKKPAQTPQDIAQREQALTALHGSVLLQTDPSQLRASRTTSNQAVGFPDFNPRQ